jgi:hypothetical protein
VTSYRLERDDGKGGEYQLVYAGPALSATATGLRSGLCYSFRLLAENDVRISVLSFQGHGYFDNTLVPHDVNIRQFIDPHGAMPFGLRVVFVAAYSVQVQ